MHRRLENLGTGDPDVAYTDNTADRGMLEGTFTGLAAGLTPLPTENPDGLVNASMVGIHLNIASDLRSAKVNADIALSELTVHLNTAPADEPFVVSMDTEWDTGDNYAKLGKVATIQISTTNNSVTVYQLSQYKDAATPSSLKFPPSLKQLLEHERVLVVGSRVNIDVSYLAADYDVEVANYQNLAMFCKSKGFMLRNQGGASLQEMCRVVLNVCRIPTVFDWTSFWSTLIVH